MGEQVRTTKSKDAAPEPASARPAEGVAAGAVPRQLLTMQRSAGNRATSLFVQAKLSVGRASDPEERAADLVADAAIAGLEGKAAGDAEPTALRRAPAPAGDDALGGLPVDDATGDLIERSRGRGRAVDPSVRAAVESASGADLRGVRVHTGDTAGELSQSLQARAFTTGSDIFFSKGAYQPGTAAGRHLLAHELAHAAQQGGSAVRRRTIRRFKAKEPTGNSVKKLTSFFEKLANIERQAASDAPRTAKSTRGGGGASEAKQDTPLLVYVDDAPIFNAATEQVREVESMEHEIEAKGGPEPTILTYTTPPTAPPQGGPGSRFYDKVGEEKDEDEAEERSERLIDSVYTYSAPPKAPPQGGPGSRFYDKVGEEKDEDEDEEEREVLSRPQQENAPGLGHAAETQEEESSEGGAPEPEESLVPEPLPPSNEKYYVLSRGDYFKLEHDWNGPHIELAYGKAKGHLVRRVNKGTDEEPKWGTEPIPEAAKLRQLLESLEYMERIGRAGSDPNFREKPGYASLVEQLAVEEKDIATLSPISAKLVPLHMEKPSKYKDFRVKMVPDEERASFILFANQGRLIQNGKPFKTGGMMSYGAGAGWAVFVMSPKGEILAAEHKVSQMHHSSFMGGGKVAGAGELQTDDSGKLLKITSKSGHYAPKRAHLVQVMRRLHAMGIAVDGIDVYPFDSHLQTMATIKPEKGKEFLDKAATYEQPEESTRDGFVASFSEDLSSDDDSATNTNTDTDTDTNDSPDSPEQIARREQFAKLTAGEKEKILKKAPDFNWELRGPGSDLWQNGWRDYVDPDDVIWDVLFNQMGGKIS